MQCLIWREKFTGELHASQTTSFLSLIYFFSSTYIVMYTALKTDGQDGILRLSYQYFHVRKKVCLMKKPVSFSTRYMKEAMYISYKLAINAPNVVWWESFFVFLKW
jgi:hypothetical protein